MHFAIYPYAAAETGCGADRDSCLSVKKEENIYIDEKKNEMRVLILWHVPKQVSQ